MCPHMLFIIKLLKLELCGRVNAWEELKRFKFISFDLDGVKAYRISNLRLLFLLDSP